MEQVTGDASLEGLPCLNLCAWVSGTAAGAGAERETGAEAASLAMWDLGRFPPVQLRSGAGSPAALCLGLLELFCCLPVALGTFSRLCFGGLTRFGSENFL